MKPGGDRPARPEDLLDSGISTDSGTAKTLKCSDQAAEVEIANQFGHASAAKSAGGRGATTSRVSKHAALSADSQAGACPN